MIALILPGGYLGLHQSAALKASIHMCLHEVGVHTGHPECIQHLAHRTRPGKWGDWVQFCCSITPACMLLRFILLGCLMSVRSDLITSLVLDIEVQTHPHQIDSMCDWNH